MFEKTREKTVLSAASVAVGLLFGAGPLRAQGMPDPQDQVPQDIVVDPDTTAVVVEVAPAADVGPAAAAADYCHAKILVPEEKPPVSSDEPQITPDTRDWIDYYGPCDAADMRDAARQERPTNPDD